MAEKEKFLTSIYLIIKNDKGQILLQRRKGSKLWPGYLALPAGHVDKNENVYDAAQREAKEELNIKIDTKNIIDTFVVNRTNKLLDPYWDIYFEISCYDGKITINEPNKCSELKWCSIYDLPLDMISFEREAIKNNLNGIKFSVIHDENAGVEKVAKGDDAFDKELIRLFNEVQNNDSLSLDKKYYDVYRALKENVSFFDVKKRILQLFEIKEMEYYTKEVNGQLRKYIEEKVFPEYSKNDRGHGIIHVNEVIRRAFALNETFYKLNPKVEKKLDLNMIYAIASWHDYGKYKEKELEKPHALIAAQEFYNDKKMSEFFTDEERTIIKEAIEDHGHSKDMSQVRSEYGKLISSADRNTTIEMVFMRSFFVARGDGKNSRKNDVIEDYLDFTINRLSKRYSDENPENMFYDDRLYYEFFLKEMRSLLNNPEEFKKLYCEVNGITDRTKHVRDYDGVDDDVMFSANINSNVDKVKILNK